MRETKEFDSLFKAYYTPLLMFALQYLNDADEADDVVSAAFEDLWRNFASIEALTAKSYLYVSVKNLCIDTLRRKRCHKRYVEFVQLMGNQVGGVNFDFDNSYKDKVIERLFSMLKPPTSDILRACYIEEKKYKQVAEEMSISVSTVKKHIIKALKIIREMRKNIK